MQNWRFQYSLMGPHQIPEIVSAIPITPPMIVNQHESIKAVLNT